MSKTWKIVLALSLAANLGIVYVGYKALEYRAHINHFLDKYTHVVREFSGRQTYAEDNRALLADEKVPNRVVFLGSQLTENWPLETHFPEWEVINRGISGQRLAGFLLRFSPDVADLRPTAVHLEFASYNFRPEHSLDELQDYIDNLAALARANDIQPILTTVIPTRERLTYDAYSVSDSLVKFNVWLRQFCRKQEYPLLDYYRLLADSRGLLPESLSTSHIALNDRGYERLSEQVRIALSMIHSRDQH